MKNATQTKRNIDRAIRQLHASRPGLTIRAIVTSEYDEAEDSETGLSWSVVLAAVRTFSSGDPLAMESRSVACPDEDSAISALRYAESVA